MSGEDDDRMDIDQDGQEPSEDQGIGAPVPAIKSIEGWILIVTNVNEEASEEEVSDIFSEYGLVQNIHLNLDRRTGYVKGYALIEYGEADEAFNAIKHANGMEFLGQNLRVDFAFVEAPIHITRNTERLVQRDRSKSPQR